MTSHFLEQKNPSTQQTMQQMSRLKKSATMLAVVVAMNGAWLSQGAFAQLPTGSFPTGGQKPVPAKVQPPDPNDGVPLSGFDYMLMASFAFGMMWIYRQKRQTAQAQG